MHVTTDHTTGLETPAGMQVDTLGNGGVDGVWLLHDPRTGRWGTCLIDEDGRGYTTWWHDSRSAALAIAELISDEVS